jgi:RHS repeat-associated protein
MVRERFRPWRYTGQDLDVATGLYKMGGRYYQPELERWTQLDPLDVRRTTTCTREDIR